MEIVPKLPCFFVLLFLGTSAYAKGPRNRTLSVGHIKCEILGRSGRIRLYSDKNANKSLTIAFDGIREIGKDGKTVVNAKHKFENFAKTDFTMETTKEGKMYNLSASFLTFSSALAGVGATMKISVIIFNENGTATVEGGEEYTVKEGSMKFNIQIRDWDFCTASTCGGKEGSFLEVGLLLKPKGKPGFKKAKKQLGRAKRKGARSPETQTIGVSKAIFSGQVKVGKNWTNMPEGFPKGEIKKGGLLYTFQFPKDKEIFYDPVMQLDGEDSSSGGSSNDDGNDDDSSASVKVSAATGMIAISLMTLLMGKFFC